MYQIPNNNTSIIDQLRARPVPYYDHSLYRQGYKPWEILWAEESPKDKWIRERHQMLHSSGADVNMEIK